MPEFRIQDFRLRWRLRMDKQGAGAPNSRLIKVCESSSVKHTRAISRNDEGFKGRGIGIIIMGTIYITTLVSVRCVHRENNYFPLVFSTARAFAALCPMRLDFPSPIATVARMELKSPLIGLCSFCCLLMRLIPCRGVAGFP